MIDDQRRRSADRALGARVSVIESEMSALGRRFERHVDDSARLIEKLDARADKADITMARLLAGLSVVMVLAQLFAPIVQRLFGLPS